MPRMIYPFPLAVLLALTNCGKQSDPVPTPTPTLVSSDNAYAGTVKLVDEFGVAVTDASGVQVDITDTSPTWTTTSNGGGSFEFSSKSVPAGTHQLRFSKQGYGTGRLLNAATGTNPSITLGQLPTTLITVKVVKAGSSYLVQGTTTQRPTATQPRFYRLFLLPKNAAAPISTGYYLTSAGPIAADGTFAVTFSSRELSAAGFKTGDNIWVFAGGDNPAATTYVDPTSKKAVYPAANYNLSGNPGSLVFN